MQQGNRTPMDERNQTPREQDTGREREPNRVPGTQGEGYEGTTEEKDRSIDIDKTPGEQQRIRRDPMTTEH